MKMIAAARTRCSGEPCRTAARSGELTLSSAISRSTVGSSGRPAPPAAARVGSAMTALRLPAGAHRPHAGRDAQFGVSAPAPIVVILMPASSKQRFAPGCSGTKTVAAARWASFSAPFQPGTTSPQMRALSPT